MIRSEDVVVDEGVFDPLLPDDVIGNEKVVDAPTGVVFAGIETVGPP